MMGTLLSLCLAGCGDTLNGVDPKNSVTNAHRSLSRPFNELLYGFTQLDKYSAKGDYGHAKLLSNHLYDEFHDVILPTLTAKKGKTYAEAIHRKYDELEEAVANKDRSKISELVKINRENMKKIAPILGVSVISSD